MSNQPENLARTVMTDPVHFLAFGFGTGLAPFAPGTFGSLPGILLFWLTLDFGLYVQLGVAVAITLAGIWICGESARRIGVHDHGGIVWDEIVGMYVTLLVAPYTLHRIGGGVGIMLDDLAAALYAIILLALYGWLMT
jgi:phosphatidylglycerophosphatase A